LFIKMIKLLSKEPMKEPMIISKREIRLMSLFFSFIILSLFLSVFFITVDKIYDKVFMEQSFVEGVVGNFTSDSIYVDVDWVVEYRHSKLFTEIEKLELKMYIIDIMQKEIERDIQEMSYKEYIEFKKQPIISDGGYSRIIIFNKLNK